MAGGAHARAGGWLIVTYGSTSWWSVMIIMLRGGWLIVTLASSTWWSVTIIIHAPRRCPERDLMMVE
eukprot:1188097-Prorocentrum_minimum.AAC.2